MGRLCQHSHGPISTATHDIILQMHRVMDWQISAEAKFETQLVSLVWCVETEARPPIVTHSCWWLNEVMGKLWQHSHAHGTFSAETLMSLRPIEAPSNNNNNRRQFWIKLNLRSHVWACCDGLRWDEGHPLWPSAGDGDSMCVSKDVVTLISWPSLSRNSCHYAPEAPSNRRQLWLKPSIWGPVQQVQLVCLLWCLESEAMPPMNTRSVEDSSKVCEAFMATPSWSSLSSKPCHRDPEAPSLFMVFQMKARQKLNLWVKRDSLGWKQDHPLYTHLLTTHWGYFKVVITLSWPSLSGTSCHYAPDSLSNRKQFWPGANLMPNLWAWCGALRWKQDHPLLPTSVEDSLGLWEGYANTLMALSQQQLMTLFSRCTE